MLAKMQRQWRSIFCARPLIVVCKNNKYKESLMLGGVFAYDFLDHFEKLPEAKQDLLLLPDFLFYLPLSVIIIDHKKQSTAIYVHAL